MGDVFSEMLSIMINNAPNLDAAMGLSAAQRAYEASGYYSLSDWENMSEEDKQQEVMSFFG